MRSTGLRNFAAIVLLFVIACTNATDEQKPLAPSATPAAAEEPLNEAPTEEFSAADDLLDDLLSNEFATLTAPWTGDLDGMIERRFIRVLVVSGGPQFFYYEGKPRGMVAEALVAFQGELNTGLGRRLDQVEIIPMPVSRDRLIPSLISGQADLVAADLTVTEARSASVDFSLPLVTGVNEIVVFAPGAGDTVKTLADLSGRTVYIRRSSSYFEHLAAMNADFAQRGLAPVAIMDANEMLRPYDILEMVNAGMIEATVIDSYKATYWSELLPDMVVRDDLIVREGGEVAWFFRKDSPQLAAVVNDFIRGHRQGTLLGNVLINRYMQNPRWVHNSTRIDALDRLQPLLDMFQRAGDANDFDPLMLAAQAYQESEFDHDRVSAAGAAGIMQIKTSTAADRNVGINDISTPDANIQAGAIYLRFLVDRYFSGEEMDPIQSWLFALAAYNAGPARIQGFRRQAERDGYDPNLWVDNVELVAARKIGSETVRYVRNIIKYY
ncbi:MAG: transporter substrate-binding domain-containing protein, partial [Gammaproteobacteria bacterium]|nr:transporter substrate-binding domain-containing protein [Gammaproteobacteria bacterium]